MRCAVVWELVCFVCFVTFDRLPCWWPLQVISGHLDALDRVGFQAALIHKKNISIWQKDMLSLLNYLDKFNDAKKSMEPPAAEGSVESWDILMLMLPASARTYLEERMNKFIVNCAKPKKDLPISVFTCSSSAVQTLVPMYTFRFFEKSTSTLQWPSFMFLAAACTIHLCSPTGPKVGSDDEENSFVHTGSGITGGPTETVSRVLLQDMLSPIAWEVSAACLGTWMCS